MIRPREVLPVMLALSSVAHAAPNAATVMKEEADLPKPTPGKCLAEGTKASEIDLPLAGGGRFSLAKSLEKGPAVIVFYRGGWCPFCNLQLREYEKLAPEFAKRGATLVAVSVDRPDPSLVTKGKGSFPFGVASDSDLTAIKAYNVAFEVPPDLVKKYKGMGIDLERDSGKAHHTIAVPAIVVVDQRNTIRWCYASEDYKVRPASAVVLRKLDAITKAK